MKSLVLKTVAWATAAALLIAGPALAQGPVTTASAAGAPAPQPTAPAPPLPAYADAQPDGPPMAMGPCGPEKIKPNGQLDTAPHGEVDLGVGTGGAHEVGGAICQPVGKDGFVAISASQTQFPTLRGR